MKAYRYTLFLFLYILLPGSFADAQPGAFNPQLLECGRHGEVEVVCGTVAPEDFERTPDGRFLIVAKMGRGEERGLDLFELATQTFVEIPLSAEKRPDWGEAACTESIGGRIQPHGLSLSKRASGEWQLYVVNHSVRESMEMYELLPDGAKWKLAWRGCVPAREPYNDVAALPDGSFVATRPQAIQKEGQSPFGGAPSGNVAVWTAGDGERVLPGSEYGYPNGVLVSGDGRFAYISGWATRDLHQYDLTAKKEVAKCEFNFMPDNLTWTQDGKILAAGIKGVNGNCPPESDHPCIQGFKVAEVDPKTLERRILYDNDGMALINGVSVATEAGNAIYVGSFQGDRLVKLPRGGN
ncbi:MAG: SMP-30/gluconolactonase/LRE family protein [Acidobacteria bacterium]|nr:SMP-30/gluconolactonase/LRE family protein [Acidobacteriota bacterium]